MGPKKSYQYLVTTCWVVWELWKFSLKGWPPAYLWSCFPVLAQMLQYLWYTPWLNCILNFYKASDKWCGSSLEFRRFLEYGSVFRTTGSTLMNQHSSRSHAIFTIIVEQRSILECATSNDVITAKFHLVSHSANPYIETRWTMSQFHHTLKHDSCWSGVAQSRYWKATMRWNVHKSMLHFVFFE